MAWESMLGSDGCGGCTPGQQYWGRHTIQLSWNYNYCSAETGVGISSLHEDPNQIFSNRVTGWKVANWYWSTQPGPSVSNGYGTWPLESSHAAMTGACPNNTNCGMAGTIRSINGGIECGSRVQQQINRVTYYNGSGGDEEDGSGGTLGVVGYGGGLYGRRFCSP
jgi:hypothetical protein